MKENNNKEKKTYSITDIIFTVIFLIWFFGSIFALIITAEINPYYTVIIFGQYFLVFGLIGLYKKVLIGGIFAVVGLICITIPILMMNPQLFEKTIIWDTVIGTLLILAFVLTGLGMAIIPIINRKRLQNRCTYEISATVIRNDIDYNEGKKLYCPIYGFYYKGKQYEVSSNQYTNINVKEIGNFETIKINPNNPEEFLSDSRNKFDNITITFGLLMFLSTFPLLIYFLLNNNLFE